MRKMMTTAAALVFAAGAVTAVGATQAQAATTASHGCDSGYVCLYPGAGWNNDRPTHKYYTYGAHNLSNMYGTYRIFNNQSGGATMQTCTGYNGTGCQGHLPSGWYIDKDMTPINSIVLNRP
ncbi:hypothetical protein SLUN_36790 [Streptomyces lunaelactis]|uniref:Peptidase inhibitor n=1 Tax=Streptomyces lunaelactis TaxID=1535768 RepID=A0A2R4TCR7_9ACTN|nr:hypothetical protein [Streptomyces lunaelactis]AVZ76920.1 hypothetical protein SLUN_36790 [Streptomyces lunaelactis]NUK00417.1 hypothetical protein [Streptomyces lunaelactis]NUK13793.1 hypothetical protein [Streptomyces lunaelactis]NUK49342.1 hypothetical protein [Streptomyces lunaelactis]NUK62772.1 hypothetical protein [Streptomyces lunaelactis]